jgi:hypothetical protein
MDCRGTEHPFVRDRQFAVATRRLRSSEAGIHLIRNGQGWPVALSAHAVGTSCDKAAVSRLDLGCAFCGDAIVGNRMAVAVARRCTRTRGRVIPRCQGCVWKSRRGNCGRSTSGPSPRTTTLSSTSLTRIRWIFIARAVISKALRSKEKELSARFRRAYRECNRSLHRHVAICRFVQFLPSRPDLVFNRAQDSSRKIPEGANGN